MHKRVSGLHLGLRAVKIPEIVDWVEQLNPNLFKVSNTEIKLPNKALDQKWDGPAHRRGLAAT